MVKPVPPDRGSAHVARLERGHGEEHPVGSIPRFSTPICQRNAHDSPVMPTIPPS